MMHHEESKIRRGSTGYMSVTRRLKHSSFYRFAYRSSRDATEGVVSNRSPNANIRLHDLPITAKILKTACSKSLSGDVLARDEGQLTEITEQNPYVSPAGGIFYVQRC